jgi:hypothetical protein
MKMIITCGQLVDELFPNLTKHLMRAWTHGHVGDLVTETLTDARQSVARHAEDAAAQTYRAGAAFPSARAATSARDDTWVSPEVPGRVDGLAIGSDS